MAPDGQNQPVRRLRTRPEGPTGVWGRSPQVRDGKGRRGREKVTCRRAEGCRRFSGGGGAWCGCGGGP
ncbi:hypothetical protein DLM49_06745 [Streptomyces sp. WAC 01438]|nr:hypothetical protein DLM49_06745 [Streptomyces sp. WAC 01438]